MRSLPTTRVGEPRRLRNWDTGTAEGAGVESRAQANSLQRPQLDPGSVPSWTASELRDAEKLNLRDCS